jgi:hypothetical protein
LRWYRERLECFANAAFVENIIVAVHDTHLVHSELGKTLEMP